jgi:hypothetical protein
MPYAYMTMRISSRLLTLSTEVIEVKWDLSRIVIAVGT